MRIGETNSSNNPITQLCIQEILIARATLHGLYKVQSYCESNKTPQEFKDRILKEMDNCNKTLKKYYKTLEDNVYSNEDYAKILDKIKKDVDEFLYDLSDADDLDCISVFDLLNNI